MRQISYLIAAGAILFSGSAFAATDQECQSLWKTLDVDANGSLEAKEDKNAYIGAMEKSGVKLVKPGVASRDEFIDYCKKSITDVKTESPANTKDLGKGDLTPSKSALSQADAQKKLEASGFRNIRDLKVDDKGIWHATAFADGKDKPVAIDAQGDIVGEKGAAPPDSSSKNEMSPAKPVPSNSAPAEPAIERGHGSTTGLYLWVFLLVGNALGLLFLNGAGGATSAMSNSRLTRAERM